jgi:hypothetical protein
MPALHSLSFDSIKDFIVMSAGVVSLLMFAIVYVRHVFRSAKALDKADRDAHIHDRSDSKNVVVVVFADPTVEFRSYPNPHSAISKDAWMKTLEVVQAAIDKTKHVAEVGAAAKES